MLLIKEDGAREDVLNGCCQFDEAWPKFVNVHENYLQLQYIMVGTLVSYIRL